MAYVGGFVYIIIITYVLLIGMKKSGDRMLLKRINLLYKDIVGKPISLWKKSGFTSDLMYIPHIDIELVSHCNLNCRGCNHYASIATRSEISLKELESEIKQLKKVFGDDIRQINLMGGEPLLHSNIVPLMGCVRKYFTNSKIVIVTNGIKLLEQNELFWETASRERIEIEVTKYPIKLNYKEIRKRAKEYQVIFSFYGRSGYVQKTQFYLPLDLEGGQNGVYSFDNCFMARRCFTLDRGRIFTCPYAAYVDRFNEFFDKHIPILEEDYGDIWKESKEDILKKLSSPIPMCRYCNVKARTYGNKWRVSDKNIKEWT